MAIQFQMNRNICYLSHLETLSMWQRVFARAQIPIVYSAGFNPHQRVSLPFPRAVGLQSENDLVCAFVEDDFGRSSFGENEIARRLPEGCRIESIKMVAGKSVFHPESAQYRFLPAPAAQERVEQILAKCRADLSSGRPVEVYRQGQKGPSKLINLMEYIEAVEGNREQIIVTCRISPSGSLRLEELYAWLGLEADQLREPPCRKTIRWTQN